MAPNQESLRAVRFVLPAQQAMEGAGFLVHRAFPSRALDLFDPFLLLDEMGPMDVAPGEAKGAPDHPHRGFETVTYMLSGEIEHEDSAGNRGRIRPGDVQWMTAGAGVIHSEEPGARLREEGGRMHGFQLWVNLPRKHKMTPPRYQEIPGDKLPAATTPDGRVRVKVIAGESLGASARIDTFTPISYLHFTLQPGGRVEQPVPKHWNAFAYVVEGEGLFGRDKRRTRAHHMVAFGNDGDAVAIEAAEGPLDVLLVAGEPLDEPVARYGPFVMNSEAEIAQAIRDYQAGRFAAIRR